MHGGGLGERFPFPPFVHAVPGVAPVRSRPHPIGVTLPAPALPLPEPAAERPSLALPYPVGRRTEYRWLAVVMVAVVAGFWPSFFQHLRAQDLAHTLHGATASLWLVVLWGQGWLIDRRWRVWHRRVAQLALPVAIASVVTALPMITTMLRSAKGDPEALGLLRLLALYDVVTLAWFVWLLSAGLANLRAPALHQRALLATAPLAIPPALTRLLVGPVGLPPLWALHLSFTGAQLLLLWLVERDWRRGEPAWPYPATLVLLVLLQVALHPVAGSAPFVAFTNWWAG